MSFELSEDHESFRKVVRDFAESEVAPHAAAWDKAHAIPVEVIHKMGDLGLFGLLAPEEYGGSGGDLTSLCIAVEEIGRADQSLGVTLEAATGLGVGMLVEHGTEEQRKRWLPDLATGRALAGFGLTEPEAGSDAGRHPHPRPPRGRRVGDRRHQAVHQQLRHPDHVAGRGHRGDGREP